MHEALPGAPAYVPAAHGTHCWFVALANVPAGQGLHEEAPVALATLPAAQAVHDVDAFAPAKLPTAHGVQLASVGLAR